MTKRNFWLRFPQANLAAMQAILRSGSPALLAGQLGVLQLMVSDSPYVDVSLAQTINGVTSLSSVAYPPTVTIDSVELPLRLTAPEVAAILAMPQGTEIYEGA
jgi:hypothetical protein